MISWIAFLEAELFEKYFQIAQLLVESIIH